MSLSTAKSWGNWSQFFILKWNHYNKSKLSNMKLYWSSFQKYNVYCLKVNLSKRLTPNYLELWCKICSKKVAKKKSHPYLHYFLLFLFGNSASATQSQRCKADKLLEATEKMLRKFSFTVGDNYQDRLFCQGLAEPGVKTNHAVFLLHPYILAACFSELSEW